MNFLVKARNEKLRSRFANRLTQLLQTFLRDHGGSWVPRGKKIDAVPLIHLNELINAEGENALAVTRT
ncbi:hypothetical protein ACWGNA_24995 [Brucella cytisi]|uniref:hypothetical protein n=1 Tax=Brucella cytisi TaxID=407152 RepID=UPI0035D9988C